MPKILKPNDAAQVQKIARTTTTRARKLKAPPYVRQDQVPWGTPGSSTKKLERK